MRTITLPDVNRLPKMKTLDLSQADSDFLPILEEMGLSNISKEEIAELQTLIANLVVKIGDKCCEQALSDYHSGKIERIEDSPMYRNADGEVIVNRLPDDCTKWIFFQVWLNWRFCSNE